MESVADLEKRIRNLNKKLGQIQKLKEKDADSLDADARSKLESESALLAEVKALERQLKNGGAPEPAPAAAKAAPAAAAPQEPAAPAEPPAEPVDKEKRVKQIRKKLAQIEKLKEKGGSELDSEALSKVNAEAELMAELAALEGGRDYKPGSAPAAAKAASAPAAKASAPAASPADEKDPHAAARAEALEPAGGDLGLLIDDETEKRFKALQKKLRDIGKLRQQETLDKLQKDKLLQEPSLIEEIGQIRAKADQLLATRRAQYADSRKAATSASAPKPASGPRPDWQCNECSASGSAAQLDSGEGVSACPKCGSSITHNAPNVDDDDEDGDDDDAPAAASTANKGGKKESMDLKTNRQKQAQAKAPSAKLDAAYAGTAVSSASAKWPEIKEVLESGDGGVDRSRQKKAIQVNQAKAGGPYDTFDSTLLKCDFLTRVELRLAPGVLSSEAFQLYFPGALGDNLLELILKDNQLSVVPPGISALKRIRSIDLSKNAIDALPTEDTWASIAGSLELLDLSFNKLTTISMLKPLTKLSQLKVDANQLTSLNGVSWKESKQLATLSAVSNQITEIPEDVEHVASLEYFELSENKLTAVPPAICELRKLKTLSIAGNPIKDQKVVKAAEKGMKDIKAYLSKVGGGKKK